MPSIHWIVGFSLLISTAMSQELQPQDWMKQFEPREFQVQEVGVLKYRLLKPADFNPDRTYPLVVFLHGAGERGSDNTAQLKHGMKEFLTPERRNDYPCYVLAPQCPTGKRWVEVDWSASSHSHPEQPSDTLRLVHDLVIEMTTSANVDKRRVYIMGLSMGGYGTWDAIARYPELFAAAIPICGGGDPAVVERYVQLPIWCFHGDRDNAVPVERSRTMIDALKKAGGNPKYTEYEGVGHDSWTATFANPEVYQWLFQQVRRQD